MCADGLEIWRHTAGHGYGRLTCLLQFMIWSLPAPYDETCIEASIIGLSCHLQFATKVNEISLAPMSSQDISLESAAYSA